MRTEQDSRPPLPAWLTEPEGYEPSGDRDGFASKSLLAVTSMLARFRLDDGRAARISPSPPLKLAMGLSAILLTSLSRNYLFVLIVLGCVLARACLLPQRALTRVAAGAGIAGATTFLVMLPAALLGQPQSALTLAGKALVCTGIALTVALTTPQARLTAALRSFGVPGLAIMTVDLALRSIVRLGETAAEVLTALTLRSVGRNRHKGETLGGVAGIVLVKAAKAAADTHDAMVCRGFDGSYHGGDRPGLRAIDLVWMCGLAALVALFFVCQGAI